MQNILDAACFQHDSAYNKYKDAVNRKQSDIVLKNKAFKIAADPKVNGYQRRLAAMVYKFFNERTKGSGIENKQLAEELQKPIIRNFKKSKVYSSHKDNIWGVDLADMSLISKFNKEIKYLLCVIDLFSKYAWVIGLKNKKGDSAFEGFQKILDSSGRKPNQIWVNHGSEFYNNKFKGFLKENDIKMYLTHNEGKSVVAKRFIKTLKNKIYKHMTDIGKNVYFDVLDDIVKKYNKTVHSSIKMKPKFVSDVFSLSMLKKQTKKTLNLKLVIISEFRDIKTIFLKVTHLIGVIMLLIKYKTLFLGLI